MNGTDNGEKVLGWAEDQYICLMKATWAAISRPETCKCYKAMSSLVIR